MANPASIRLGTTGKAQVKADLTEIGATGTASFKSIGDAGDAQAKRWSKSYENAGRDVEAALERQRRAAEKISAIMPQTAVQMQVNAAAGSNTRFGGGYAASASDRQTSAEGTARQSAMFFAELAAEEERLAARTRALVSAIDPAFAAQERFNREIGEARALVSAGTLSLDQYVAKLRMEQEALDAVGRTGKRTGTAFAAAAPQIQDLFTQISMGGNPVNALVVQGGQLAGQLQYAGGKAEAFSRILMGPWGIAAQVALLVLSPLLGKMIDFSDATEDAIDKLKKDAKETETTRIAKERFARSAEGVAASIREQATALDTAAKSERSAAERANILAKENLKREMSIRAVTAAMLDQAIAQENVDRTRAQGPGQRGELGTLALTESSGRVAGLQTQLQANQKAIDEAKRNLMGTRIDLATESAARSADPMARIKKQYDDQATAARNAARVRIKAGQDVDGALTRELATIERNRAAAVKAEQDKQKALNQTAKVDKDTVTASQVAKILRAELPGVRVTSTTRTAEHNREIGGAPNSNHVKGTAIDFVPAGGMGAITKEDVRRIFTARGIDVLELLGPGDKGHSDHFHVAWTKGKLALDDFNDAAKRNKEAQRDLERANKVLNDDLDEVVKQFDPARAAADEYAASLAKIAALRGAGKLTADQAGDYTFALFKERQAKAAADQVASFKTMFGDIEDPFAAGNASWRVQQDEQINAWDVENERRERAQQDGVRTVAGLYRNLMSGGTRSIFDSFKEMGMNAIADLAAKWTLSQIGKLSGKGGILGSLASLVTGTSKAVATTAGAAARTTGPPAYATGTEYASGGAAIVGEFGKELVNLPRGSRVTPAAETRRMLAGNDNAPATVNHFHLDSPVVTQDLLDQMNAIGSGAAVRGAAGGAAMGMAENKASAARKLGRRW